MNATARLPIVEDAHRNDDALSIDLIRRALGTRNVGFEIHLFGVVSSTNDVAHRLAEEGAREGTVVLAEAQHAGRRRFGRPWFSPERANLYASVIFRPAIAPAAAPVFTMIASLALADAVTGEGVPATVRWPNDVVVAGRRIGGTLATAAVTRDVVQHVVLGVGVNLNVSRDALTAGLGPAAALATSVREVAGRAVDRNRFAASLLNRLERWHGLYTDYGPEAILVAWNQRDAVCGRMVEISQPEGVRHGRVVRVDADGRLVLESRPGDRRPVAGGEIMAIDGMRTR
ncbi:MAG TPA: biotin--[acetyl-CoA-carboxylase] ligase [Candidatus Acidoferrum sp.]|nr:biotin--[acetyl-CoA-carboxylase] ligase [Candidatus Acidoferrum sp.]